MVPETPNGLGGNMISSALARENSKRAEVDVFVCDVADAVIKDILPQMEHPFYSLSKKPELEVRRYNYGKNWIEIMPSIKGMATIYDKDILIYAISQVMAKMKNGEKVSRRVRINTRDLLQFCNRGTAGKDYKALCEAIDRLAGTRIATNIYIDEENEEEYTNFGLIDQGTIRRSLGVDGRLVSVTLDISDWVFNAIEKKAVLTLNRSYFTLKKPIERRIYEIARKHCGHQSEWMISVDKLLIKTGSQSPLKKFRFNVQGISDRNNLPDYDVSLDRERDMVTFTNRNKKILKDALGDDRPAIQSTETYETVKSLVPHGVDIYAIEQEWIEHWRRTGCELLRSPDLAFIGFVRVKFQQ
jgi:plasmid replication initiation protein